MRRRPKRNISPALWWHTTYTLEPSLGVNLFWRDPLVDPGNVVEALCDGCVVSTLVNKTDLTAHYNKKDLYGNRDLAPAEALLKQLDNETVGAFTFAFRLCGAVYFADFTIGTANDKRSLQALLADLNALPEHYRQFYAKKFVATLKRKLNV